MTIHETDGRGGLPPGFLDLPGLVYRDDPHWIPEDAEAVAAEFTPANEYFTRGEARAFCIPGKVRAAAFFDPALRVDGAPVAFAGYFESTGDQDADAALFRRIEGWARTRGAVALYGPVQWSTVRGYRLRLSAEPGGASFLGEPYNPPTYPALFEALGFTVAHRYVSQIVPLSRLHQALGMLHPIRDALLAQGYRFVVPTPEMWLAHRRQICEITDTIFSQSFAYTRLSDEAHAALYGPAVVHRICQRSSVLVFAPDGAPVAYGLSYPAYGPLLVQARGTARVPLRAVDFQRHAPLLAAHPPRACVGKTLGVHPDHRRKGIKEALLLLGFERGLDAYDVWIAGMMREDNSSSNVFAHVATGERTYALYGKNLAAAQEIGGAP